MWCSLNAIKDQIQHPFNIAQLCHEYFELWGNEEATLAGLDKLFKEEKLKRALKTSRVLEVLTMSLGVHFLSE